MDILFITRPIVPPWNEGSKNLAWQIASRMKQHRAHLMTMRGTALPDCELPIVWRAVYTAPKLEVSQRIRLLIHLLRSQNNVQLFHFFFVPTLTTSLILTGISRLQGKATIQTVPSLPKAGLTRTQAQRLFFADHIVTFSEQTTRSLQEFGLTNVMQINVGVDVEYYQQASAADLHHSLGIASDSVIVLFAGEYSRLGAIDRLRSIMPAVIAQCPNCHFIIACRILLPTDPPIKASLQRFVQDTGLSDRVHFLGEVADFSALLKSSDIFLYPVSDMTGKIDAPLTLIEAMAAGLSIVSNDIAPLNELFASESGEIVPVGDDRAMVDAILMLAKSQALRLARGVAALETARARYPVQRMVQAYERLYDKMG